VNAGFVRAAGLSTHRLSHAADATRHRAHDVDREIRDLIHHEVELALIDQRELPAEKLIFAPALRANRRMSISLPPIAYPLLAACALCRTKEIGRDLLTTATLL
jgi:hypothetical protein